MEPVLELREVRKRFGTTPAVDGVSLSIQQGEVFTLLGPSGCGKSTTLRVLSDRIAVMRAGRIEQVGTPVNLYEHPATPFVRDFLGRLLTLDVTFSSASLAEDYKYVMEQRAPIAKYYASLKGS